MRILIVEDDASLASGVSRILEAEGYAVDMTSRGEEAVEAAKRERFDLVILDIGLPGMDGFEALRRLRGAEHRVPVLVLTARDTVSDRVHGLDHWGGRLHGEALRDAGAHRAGARAVSGARRRIRARG